jgi:hypothetical protein
MPKQEPDLNKLKVEINVEVKWPTGERHKLEMDIPVAVLLMNDGMLAEDWLRMLDFFSHDAGILNEKQRVRLIDYEE